MPAYFRRDDWVTDALGNAISGASVYVCSQPANTGTIPPSPEVQLYADPLGTTPISQPVLTDGYGHAFYYVLPGTYTIVYYSPQIQEVVLADQTIAAGSISFPVSIAEGGTSATTALGALVNLGAAASGANADITSLSDIPNTTFDSTGWKFGAGTFGSNTVAQVANQSWAGTGYTGAGIGMSSATQFSLMTPSAVVTSGTLQGNALTILGNGVIANLAVGTASTSTVTSAAGNVPITVRAQGVTTALNSVIIDSAAGPSPIPGVGLLGFTTYPTQTTVGAAGGATALPATPTGYLQVTINGTEYVIPYYAHA